MKRKLIKFVVIIVICMLSIVQMGASNSNFLPTANAQPDPAPFCGDGTCDAGIENENTCKEDCGDGSPDITDGGQQIICDGYRDWSTFISATIAYDGFVEYWKDILVRYNTNICLYEDVESLRQRIIKSRKKIREAFYACAKPSKVERLKNSYYELETMLFFLRNYVSVGDGQFNVRDDQDVINDLSKFYVFNIGYFSSEKSLELFQTFKDRYGTRIEAYQNCSDSTWEGVVDKWNEFKKDAGGITPALEKAKDTAEKKWARLKNASQDFGSTFVSGLTESFKINGLSPEEGLGQIIEELKRSFPDGVTIQQAQTAKHRSDQKRNYQETEIGYHAQYANLYRESSDEYTRLIEQRLETLNGIIKNTFQYQNQTIHCTKDINDQQC